MEEGICSPISDLASHSSDHIKALDSLKQNMDKEISFQNALEVLIFFLIIFLNSIGL